MSRPAPPERGLRGAAEGSGLGEAPGTAALAVCGVPLSVGLFVVSSFAVGVRQTHPEACPWQLYFEQRAI